MKRKKMLIIILMCLLTFFRIYFTLGFKPALNGGMRYDDSLFLNTASSILKGNWLGKYNDIILTKGIGFELIAVFLSIFKIPYLLGITAIYILASFLLANSIKKVFKRDIYFLISYTIFLFNPISYAVATYLRFYRNGIVNISIIMLIFSILINIINDKKNKLCNYIILGLVLFLCYITREDSFWIIIISFLVLTFKFFELKNLNTLKKVFLLIPIFIFLAFSNILSLINYFNYGVYTNNELKNSAFASAYLEILKVKPSESINQVSITKDTLNKIAEISPTFANILPNLNKQSWGNSSKGEISDGYMFWALRFAAYNNGYYDSSQKSEQFWQTVEEDIIKAVKEKKLETRLTINSIFISPYQKGYLFKTFESSIDIFIRVNNYQKIDIDYGKCYCTDIQGKDLSSLTNYNINVNENKNYEKNYVNIEVLKQILILYQKVIPFISVLGIISFINFALNIKHKKEYKKIMIVFTFLLSIIFLILGIAYTNVSAFNSITYYYLAPIYNLVIFLNLFLIFEFIENFKKNGVEYGKNRIKHLITLSK